MAGRTRITGIMTTVFMTGVMVGCSIQTGNQAAPTAEKQQTKEAVQETGLQKSTHPESLQVQSFPDVEKKTKAEPLTGGKRIVLITGIHYLVESLTDQGDMLQAMVKYGDEKLTNYVWEITDAALEEVKFLGPDVLIVSRDLSLRGEEKSHEELAKKLDEVEKAGITALVIPGDHDINDPGASMYSGGDRYSTESTTPEDFECIYKEFGYSEASSRDVNSPSYTYDLRSSMRLLILDICQHRLRNKVGEVIKTETYRWIKKQLEQAARDGVILLPMAHHNLLEESKIHADDCAIRYSEELIQILEGGNIPLFLNGHLCVQHFMGDNDIGAYEMVTSSLFMPPCRHGILDYMGDETLYYYIHRANMEKWARRNESTDENLLNLDTYSPPILKQIFYNQACGAMKNSTEEETDSIFVELTGSGR